MGNLKVHIIYLMDEIATLTLLVHIKMPVSEIKKLLQKLLLYVQDNWAFKT